MRDRATILVVQRDHADRGRLCNMLEAASFEILTAANGKEALELICSQPPICVIIDGHSTNALDRSILESLKSDSIYGHLPVLLIITQEELDAGIDWDTLPADDYIVRPFTNQELLSRVSLATSRARRDRHANPLTGLPGNPSIMAEVDRRLRNGLAFAMCYLDLDHFKAFNDHYGFARGDEIIRMTGRLLVNTVKSIDSQDSSVGHVGGDDFVFLVPPTLAPEVCEKFLADFDQIVPNFYDEDDRVRGGFEGVDRQGRVQRFPIVSCSIAVVDTSSSPVRHIGDLCTRIAEVKSHVKKVPGSAFLVDRRK